MPTTHFSESVLPAAPLHVTITDDTSGAAAPVLVLLHGVFMDSTLWDAVLPLLPGTRTIRLDMPSHGASPDMAPGASLADHVTSVAATLDALGVRGAVVAGHSWGGMVALRLAHRRPDLVAGLVLSNTPLKRVRGATRLGFGLQRLLLAAGLPPRLYGRMAGGALIGTGYRTAHPDDVSALARRTDAMGRRRLRETLRSVLLEPEDALDLLPSLTMPWTAVAGAQDYVLSDEVRETLTSAGRLEVSRGGHTTPLEDPAAAAGAIRSVIARVRSTAV
jgi:3-oxoadipate enol-lactonase